MQKNDGKLHFFSKIFGHVKKKQYLCTRFRKESATYRIGAVVQLVRIHACHAWGRGFESRPHRKKQSERVASFLQYSVWIPETGVQKPNKQIAIDYLSMAICLFRPFALHGCLDVPHESADTDFLVAFVEFLYGFE